MGTDQCKMGNGQCKTGNEQREEKEETAPSPVPIASGRPLPEGEGLGDRGLRIDGETGYDKALTFCESRKEE